MDTPTAVFSSKEEVAFLFRTIENVRSKKKERLRAIAVLRKALESGSGFIQAETGLNSAVSDGDKEIEPIETRKENEREKKAHVEGENGVQRNSSDSNLGLNAGSETKKIVAEQRNRILSSHCSFVVIVGCGEIAELYLQCLLRSFMYGRHVLVIGLVDPLKASREKMRDIVNAYEQEVMGLERPKGMEIWEDSVVNNIRRNHLKENYTYIAVNLIPAYPTSEREMVLNSLLEQDIHVWSEKPLILDADKAFSLVKKARHRNLLLGVAPVCVFGGAQRTLKRLVLEDKCLGNVLVVEANLYCGGWESKEWRLNEWKEHRRMGKGSMIDVGIYPIALLVHLFGPVSYLSDVWKVDSSQAIEQVPLSAIDLWSIRLVFENPIANGGNKVVATITCSFTLSSPKNEDAYRMTIRGTEGKASLRCLWDTCTQIDLVLESGNGHSVSNIPLIEPSYKVNHNTPHPIACNWALGVEKIVTALVCDSNSYSVESCRKDIEQSAIHAIHYAEVIDEIIRMGREGPKLNLTLNKFTFNVQLKQLGLKFSRSDEDRGRGNEAKGFPLIFGCMRLHEKRKQAYGILDKFVKMGGFCFDLAHVYGKSENLFGEWLVSRTDATKEGGLPPWLRLRREQLILIGKGGHPHGVEAARLSPEEIEKDLLESLNRLQTTYLDVFLLHRDDPSTDLEGLVMHMHELVNTKKIRAWGVSNWTLSRYQLLLSISSRLGVTSPKMCSNQFSLATPFHDLWPGAKSFEKNELKKLCNSELAEQIVAWSPLGEGFLAKWDISESLSPRLSYMWEGKKRNQSIDENKNNKNIERKKRCMLIAKRRNLSPTQVALAYCLRWVTCAIIGTMDCEHMDELFTVVNMMKTTCQGNENCFLSETEITYLEGSQDHP